MIITIEIPAGPAYSISPNSRKHWRVKHRESQEAKWLAANVASNALRDDNADAGPRGPVNLHWTIYLGKGRKVMDRDNATATLKPYLDGLVTVDMIEDDTQDIVRAITVDQVRWAYHKGDAKIVVEISPSPLPGSGNL